MRAALCFLWITIGMTATARAQDDIAEVPGEPLHVEGQERMTYVLIGAIDDAHAAGVGQFNVPAGMHDLGGHAVARHAACGIDDGDTPAGQPVEKTRLADVRPAHDGDHG